MDEPLGRRNYETFARRYAARVGTKPHNAYYERPATLSLLPDVAGRRVLDAGCGPGHYAAELLDRGAAVTAFDVTPAMVALAEEHTGGRAKVLQADFEEPLSFAADAEFDVVLCALALDYVEDWEPVFAEFARVLRPGGVAVLSHGHPMGDYHVCRAKSERTTDYFATERHEFAWTGFGEPRPRIAFYRRSLSATLNPLLAAGLALDRILEPLPTDEFRRADPDGHAHLMREPAFLCVRARKPGGSYA